ncbi:L,D-transpeptidase family protein [Clostridium chauvoei]|uniref:L,D-TPase catalytic domain-containing protein n=3 Tax=Clostridium chauvoei TaxID=46867 RepID=A0A1U6IWH1_9CLOT|nr:L,D-transpeptidase family protein [Clostridium chauvoei]ATD56040.1 hypothetical protein BTM20_12855 [Clostridium chauvoei]ATD58187.1 hypothetical protein BTM21_10755 [Clostridium chauvoei]MBX7281632.1 L,D-transpeptidase family protein [Clostridium chauvoei]MBX7284147.1 L,D-transpeptidase family protein [Clostridium chauvoei]MBX7286675.1 L,D-transpeptidase family protein [Clostridium chauvoei]
MKKFYKFLSLALLVTILIPSNNPKAYIDSNSIEPKYIIYIDVNSFTLSLINNKTKLTEKIYPVAIGKPNTPSPIGTWQITSKALMKDAFGGYWLGLNVPWDTFGIHGTNRPDSIGTMASGGCIRMYNHNVKELFNLVDYGTSVVISGGPNWRFSNYNRIIKPNNRGTDVYLVQMKLKALGYFPYPITGIYESTLEKAVLSYKEEHGFPVTNEIDSKFLDSIGLWKFE